MSTTAGWLAMNSVLLYGYLGSTIYQQLFGLSRACGPDRLTNFLHGIHHMISHESGYWQGVSLAVQSALLRP